MIFLSTSLVDARVIELERRGDDRGFFARAFCEDEFARAGLIVHFAQMNNSLSTRAGTLRGMHFQRPPASEIKVVRCIRGALWDCIVDLRPDSPTYLKWMGIELSAENRRMLYVPRGFAHGFITLKDDTEALYMVSDPYAPERESGLRWDEPVLSIAWPRLPVEISAKDGSWSSLDPEALNFDEFAGIR